MNLNVTKSKSVYLRQIGQKSQNCIKLGVIQFYRVTARNATRRPFCPSVCPSVCQTLAFWQNERNLCPHSYTTWRSIFIVFWKEEWLVGVTPSTWNFWGNWLCWSVNADFQLIVQLTLTGRFTTSFPRSPRWTLYIAPKPLIRGAEKRKMAVFRLKLHFLKTVCYKVSFWEYCQRQVVRYSLTYLSVQEWFEGTFPYYVKLWLKLTMNSLRKRRFPVNIGS